MTACWRRLPNEIGRGDGVTIANPGQTAGPGTLNAGFVSIPVVYRHESNRSVMGGVMEGSRPSWWSIRENTCGAWAVERGLSRDVSWNREERAQGKPPGQGRGWSIVNSVWKSSGRSTT